MVWESLDNCTDRVRVDAWPLCLQFQEPLWFHQKEEFIEHMRTGVGNGCGRLIQVDGHAKLFQDHCIVRMDPEPAEKSMVGGFLYTCQGYCAETPERGDGRYCKRHMSMATKSQQLDELEDTRTLDREDDDMDGGSATDAGEGSQSSGTASTEVRRYRTRSIS